MKLKFKKQAYQAKAVQAVVDCFKGQRKQTPNKYAIDPGVQVETPTPKSSQSDLFNEEPAIE